MLVKVCGITEQHQLEELDNLNGINFIGNIFYPISKRYAKNTLPATKNAEKVGVFVNETVTTIIDICRINSIEIVQLHGNESPSFCEQLSQHFRVIRAIPMDDSTDFESLKAYESVVDYFLLDTKTIDYGGSGQKFDWNILSRYQLTSPFILSGGISFNDVEILKSITHPEFIGIDINSCFEIRPGIKNTELIKNFIHELNN